MATIGLDDELHAQVALLGHADHRHRVRHAGDDPFDHHPSLIEDEGQMRAPLGQQPGHGGGAMLPADFLVVAKGKEDSAPGLEASLKELEVDFIDAYYLMAVNNPALVKCEELYDAFLAAKKAGKVSFFGLSTHKNAQKVLEAAIETGWYDVAMIGITPVGWYDWETHDLVPGSQTLVELKGLLDRAHRAGIGLVGMKREVPDHNLRSHHVGVQAAADRLAHQ